MDPSLNNNREAMPTYRVTTLLVEPFMMRTEGEGYGGYLVDLLDRIGQVVGFKYNISLCKDRLYGSVRPDGRWSGMIGELINEEADIAAAAMTLTSERERVVDFTKPFMSTSVSFLVNTPTEQKPTEVEGPNLGFLLEPFSITVWLCILIALVVVAILLMLIGRFNPYEWRQVPADKDPRGARHSFGLRESLMFVVSTVTLQGYRETPRSLSGRVLVVSWFIFIFFTVVAYIGNIVAFLLAGTAKPLGPSAPFNNINDLVQHKAIDVGIFSSGSSFSNLKHSSVFSHKQLAKYIMKRNSFVKNYREGVEKVRHSNGTFAMMLETSFGEYLAQKDCSLMMYGEKLFESSFGLATPKGSRLGQVISIEILRLRESGFLQMLWQKWWMDGQCVKPELVKRSYSKPQSTVMALRMAKMAVPFLVLLVGAILSAMVLVGEVLFKIIRE